MKNLHPVIERAVVLLRSRQYQNLKPRRDLDLDYSSLLLNVGFLNSLHNLHVFDNIIDLFYTSHYSRVNTDSPPLTIYGLAFPRLRTQLKDAGDRVFYVKDSPRVFRWLVMLKEIGTIMMFNVDKNKFYNLVSETTLEDIDDYVLWPSNLNMRAMTNDTVQLPTESKQFPSYECKMPFEPRYEYFDEWQALVRGIAASMDRSIPPWR